ncbi:MAG: gliding motility-associated transporter permease protein [Planctomycetaceae bacterium]|nr:gliding motility-associated transporter permease protein [Planctomycetaceae bacterium]
MQNVRDRWSLPLFVKELVELSGKRQTYVIRVSYAVALYLFGLTIWFLVIPGWTASVVSVLEVGPLVGNWIFYLQAVGIQWLWPIMACGAFTIEKERNTLQLLLLTRLSPATIVLEKFFSRLVVVATFLFISLPILAFCLGIGGISVQDLTLLSLVLSVQAIEVTAIALMCSAYCRTTTGSLIATLVLAVLIKTVSCFLEFSFSTSPPNPSVYLTILDSLQLRPPFSRYSWQLTAVRVNGLGYLWQHALPSLNRSVICLMLCRRFLIDRTFVSNTETSLKSFVDRVGKWAHRLNQNSVTRGAILIREGRREPDNDPVAWRETTTRALGQPRYLIGNFLALEFPIIWFLSIVVARLQGDALIETIGTMQMYLWIGMLLMISTVISGMIIQERQKQTWETLLVTPMTNREIVQQKMDGIQRMLWILQAPLWTCMAFRAYHEATIGYVLNEASMLLLYPRLVAWIAMTCGVIYTNRVQAILMTIVTVAGWILLGALIVIVLLIPINVIVIPIGLSSVSVSAFLLAAQFCPLTLLLVNLSHWAHGNPSEHYFLIHGVWNLILYSAALKVLRHHCLTVADRYLRGPTPGVVASTSRSIELDLTN